MMIEFKISHKLMSFVKILMTLSLVSILFCEGVFSKRSVATTVSQIDKFVTKNKKYNKSKMLSDSFDQICLPAYLQLFSGNVGRFNSTSNHTIFDNLDEANYQFIKHEWLNSHNGLAFDTYLKAQSIFISGKTTKYIFTNIYSKAFAAILILIKQTSSQKKLFDLLKLRIFH